MFDESHDAFNVTLRCMALRRGLTDQKAPLVASSTNTSSHTHTERTPSGTGTGFESHRVNVRFQIRFEFEIGERSEGGEVSGSRTRWMGG